MRGARLQMRRSVGFAPLIGAVAPDSWRCSFSSSTGAGRRPVLSLTRRRTAGRLLVLAMPKRQHVVVLVAGEADRATALLLREKLVDSLLYRPRSLVVDATDLTSCDPHGLDALLDAVAMAERSGGT